MGSMDRSAQEPHNTTGRQNVLVCFFFPFFFQCLNLCIRLFNIFYSETRCPQFVSPRSLPSLSFLPLTAKISSHSALFLNTFLDSQTPTRTLSGASPSLACLLLWPTTKSDNLFVCFDQGQELVLGSAHQLPDLLPVLVHLEGGHGRDARRGCDILVLVHVDLDGLVRGGMEELGEDEIRLIIRVNSSSSLIPSALSLPPVNNSPSLLPSFLPFLP